MLVFTFANDFVFCDSRKKKPSEKPKPKGPKQDDSESDAQDSDGMSLYSIDEYYVNNSSDEENIVGSEDDSQSDVPAEPRELGVSDPSFESYTFPEFSYLPLHIGLKFLANHPKEQLHPYLVDGFKLGKRIPYDGRLNYAVWLKREGLLDLLTLLYNEDQDTLEETKGKRTRRKLPEVDQLPKVMVYPDDYG